MEALKNTVIKEITVVSKYPYKAGLLYDKYKNGRGYVGIVVIVSGEMEFEFSDGHIHVLKSGDVALFSEGSAYKVRNNTEKDVMHYSVNFSCVGDSLFENEIYFKCSDFRKITELCDGIYESWCASDALSKIRGISVLYELVATLFEEKLRNNIGINDYEHVVSLKRYIEEHYGEKLDLDILASKSMMSKTNFRRVFNRIYSVSPIEYLIQIRLARASELIFTGNYEIAEIARLCGFTSPSYFSDLFKKRTGYAPASLRKGKIPLEYILRIISKGEPTNV